MALSPEEEKRLAQLNAQKESNKTGKLQKHLEDERLGLLNRQTEALKKQNEIAKKNFQLGSKAQRQSTAFAEKEKKLLAEQEKSFASRISNLLKGNLLQAAGFDKTEAARTAEVNLAKEANALSKDILITEKLTAEQRVGLQDLTKDIVDGAVTEKGEVEARINALGVESDAKKALLNPARALKKTSLATSEVTKQSAIRAAKFSKGVAAGGAAFAVLYQLAQQFAGQLDAIGKTFGSINVLGDDFQDTLMDSTVTATRLGGSVEDVAGITANLASNFGIGLDAAAGLSSKIIDTSKAVGLSSDEAANLFGVLMQTSNLSAVQAERLGEGAFQLARANQVNPAQVLRDIAGSSETIALFTKGGADNIAEAAVQARKFGVSLDTSAKIAEGLLDFENSIAKEMEASVLIGRQLNLQKAREAALNNDIAGAMEEVVRQVGSEAEFNALNVLERKALADVIGVSVADMSKLVGETAKAGVQAKGFRDLFGAEGLSDFTLLMNELKATTVGLVNALGPGLMAISKVLNLLIKVIQPIIDVINFVFRGISSSLDFVTDALPSVARPVNDLQVSQGGVSVISGPAGTFAPNPKDVVTAYQPSPMGNVSTGAPVASNGNINISAPQEIIVRADGNDLVDRIRLGANYTSGRPGEGLVGA